ncbi:MAG TPA: serine hydrolase [Spirochaetia bacterium]|nr:serine hydrolase [Spirochaetia bacterium]
MQGARLLLCAAVALMAACSPKTPIPQDPAPATLVKAPESPSVGGAVVPWPTRGWKTSTPMAQGMDADKLQSLLDSARMQNLSLHSVLVIRHGSIVMEKYFGSWDAAAAHSLFSCTKSFVSALAGIALDKGLIPGLDSPVLSFFAGQSFEEFDSRKRAMTVENLLTMSTGLGWREEDETYQKMYTDSGDWVKFILDLPMVSTPGRHFDYSSGSSHLISAIIQETSGVNGYDFARENLFGPLGIKDPSWERDPAGIPVGGWGLSLTPRDMAKLGYLYLHDGAWDGKQVVPAYWVSTSTQPQIKASDTWEYGYQWWVDPDGAFFAAVGRYGQGIFVVPGLDLVVVFTAHIDSTDTEAELLKKYIIPACRPDHSS